MVSKLLINQRFPFLFLSFLFPILMIPVVQAMEWIDGTHLLPSTVPIDLIPSAPAQRNPLQIGDQRIFFAVNFRTQDQYNLRATLRGIGDFCYVYVQNSEWNRRVNSRAITNLIRSFERSTPTDPNRGIYQIQTKIFGQPPDRDGDERVFFLLLDIPSDARGQVVAGYFSDIDQQRGQLRDPKTGKLYNSNELDLIYLDTNPISAGGPDSLTVLAHEFQHLIHWKNDRRETVWVNESLSEFAMFICGFPPLDHLSSFESNPEISLIDWDRDSPYLLASYGAAYLWSLYLYEHHGKEQIITTIARSRSSGISGINQALRTLGSKETFQTVYADWKIANLVDDLDFGNGKYGYRNANPRIQVSKKHQFYPVKSGRQLLKSYSVNYISFAQSSGEKSMSLSMETDGKYNYDVRVITKNQGKLVDIIKLPIETLAGKTIPNFGRRIDEVILVPSLSSEAHLLGIGKSTYIYNASLQDEVDFEIFVINNPIHRRYWEILAIPSQLSDPPTITIRSGNDTLIFSLPIPLVSDQPFFAYSFYLPLTIEAKSVEWFVSFLNTPVASGKLPSLPD